MKKIKYLLAWLGWRTLSIIPLTVVYLLSDMFFFIIYYVAKYRRGIVAQNLRNCFPNKTDKEIEIIQKKFYSFFCDVFLEAPKLSGWNEKKIMKHMRFINSEQINEDIANNRSVSLFLGHYGNWEWISSMALWLNKNIEGAEIYKRLKGEIVDRIMIENREKFGVKCVEMNNALRWVVDKRKADKITVVGYIADQSPNFRNSKVFVDFLNHSAPTYVGAEKITKKYKLEAYYVDVKRIKRGFYTAELKKMHDNPSELPDFKLMELFYKNLEQTISSTPELYLWTHKRFKFAKQLEF